MSRIPPSLHLATGLLVLLAATGCRQREELPAPPSAEATTPSSAPAPAPAPIPAVAPLAVQGIVIGNAIGPDDRIATPMSTLGTRDTAYVSIHTTGTANGNTLGVRWSFQDGSAEGKTLALDERAITGGNLVNEFHATTSTGWPVGRYKVEVMLDGTPVESGKFEVR